MKRLTPFLFAAAITLAGWQGARAESTPGMYEIDTAHSGVTFQIMHNGVNYVPGMFTKFKGTIDFNEKDPADDALNLTIQADSIFTGNQKRDQHLKGPDFFNVKQFPEITFVSTSIKPKEDGGYDITGDLTMLGKTNTVTLNSKLMGSNKAGDDVVIGGWAEFSLKRSLFGMDYGGGKIGDDVIVKIHIQAKKKS